MNRVRDIDGISSITILSAHSEKTREHSEARGLEKDGKRARARAETSCSACPDEFAHFATPFREIDRKKIERERGVREREMRPPLTLEKEVE